MKLAPTLDKDQLIVMNLCGRGDKDVLTVAQHHGGRRCERAYRRALRRAAGDEGAQGWSPSLTAGDPDHETSFALLAGLPAAGADLIEIGMPFTDPMADGPAIQAASLRALAAGARMTRTLELVRRFSAPTARRRSC